jgi:hypothetical protein
VKIEGSKVTALSEGSMFVIPREKYCNLKKNKGTQKRKWKGYVVGKNLVVYGDYKLHSVFYVHSDNPSDITIQSPVELFIL